MLTPLRVEEARGLPALAALAPAWADLACRDPRATPFQLPEWGIPYCRAFGVAEPWMVAVRRGERLVALATLVVYPEGARRVATLLGGGRSDWQDALVDPDLAPDGAALLLERMAERRAGYDALLLERLPADGWLARATAPAALAAAEDGEDEPCPALELPDGPDEVIQRVAPHVRENVRYGRRRLARSGAVEVARAGPGEVDAHLAALTALHAARWSSRGQAGVLAEANVLRFHAEATRALAVSGRLWGRRLVVGGRTVAVWHGFTLRDRLFYYLGGFDPALRAASPGAVLLADVAEEAVRAGLRRLDLLRGREPYKYAWGAVDRPAVRKVLVPHAARGVEAAPSRALGDAGAAT